MVDLAPFSRALVVCALLPTAIAADCFGGDILTCADDADCLAPDLCVNGNDAPCSNDDVACACSLPSLFTCEAVGPFVEPRDGLVASDGHLVNDRSGADCSASSPPRLAPVSATFIVSGGFRADFSGDEVAWAAPDESTAHACLARPFGIDRSGASCNGTVECQVTCPLCLVSPAPDIAVQFKDDDGRLSNPLCIESFSTDR